MNAIDNVLNLLQGPTQTSAIILAAAAFVLGMIAMCLLCKLSHGCGKKSCSGSKKGNAPRKERDGVKFEKRHPAPADGSIEIYVGNLNYDLNEAALKAAFEVYGKVNDARIITHKVTGKSKGFGFVHMPVKAEAEAAVKALDGKDLEGRPLKCNMAKNVY